MINTKKKERCLVVSDVFPDDMTFNKVVKEVLTGCGGGVGEAGNSLVPTHPQAKRTQAGLVLAWKEHAGEAEGAGLRRS